MRAFSLVLLLGVAGCATDSPLPALEARGVYLVEGQIGPSGPYFFMVDTGVDPSVIDLKTAKAANVIIDASEQAEAEGAGDGAGLALMQASLPNLALGDQQFGTIDAVAADLSAFSKALGRPLGGILGFSLLEGRCVRFDYPAKEIAFADSCSRLRATSTQVTRRFETPLQVNSPQDPIPVFPIIIGSQTVLVSLDTGKSSGIELYQPALARLDDGNFDSTGDSATRLGARGERTVTKGKLRAVFLGPYEVVDVPASISGKSGEDELREGNAGNAFLKNFVVTIDYSKDYIIFEK